VKARKLILEEAAVGRPGEIVVTATPQEWVEVYLSLGEVDSWLDKDSPAWKLTKALTEAGVI
jgi:hypothetical protein